MQLMAMLEVYIKQLQIVVGGNESSQTCGYFWHAFNQQFHHPFAPQPSASGFNLGKLHLDLEGILIITKSKILGCLSLNLANANKEQNSLKPLSSGNTTRQREICLKEKAYLTEYKHHLETWQSSPPRDITACSVQPGITWAMQVASCISDRSSSRWMRLSSRSRCGFLSSFIKLRNPRLPL